MDPKTALVDALAYIGLTSGGGGDAAEPEDSGIDLVVDPDGVRVPLAIKARSLVTEDDANRLLRGGLKDGVTLVVVGDRVTEGARRALFGSDAGYLDLRGRLAIRSSRLILDAPVETLTRRADRVAALRSPAGLEVAVALLLRPSRAARVREVAREVGRAASTVSEILASFRREGLVDNQNKPDGSDLFWQVAEHWSSPSVLLAAAPSLTDRSLWGPLRLGIETGEPSSIGWALTDSLAAAAYGAPVALRADQVPEFFVPDATVLRRAGALLGNATATSAAKAIIREAPVPAVVRNRTAAETSGWPLAHPLFVALDLAQDAGRGREILDAWTPESGWDRVW